MMTKMMLMVVMTMIPQLGYEEELFSEDYGPFISSDEDDDDTF